MEEYLDYEEWNDQSNFGWTTFSGNFESDIVAKLNNDDYFIRKQTLSDAILYLQNSTNKTTIMKLLNSIKVLSRDEESSLRVDLAEHLMTIKKLCSNFDFNSTPNDSESVGQENHEESLLELPDNNANDVELIMESAPFNSDPISSQEINTDYVLIDDFLIPIISKFLHDSNKQVRISAHASLLQLIEQREITKDKFMQEMFPSLEETMDNCNPDEMRSECFSLLVQVSHMLSNCLERTILEYSQDLLNTNDNLRKSCASHLCSIIQNSSPELMTEWLKVYYKLAEDPSWYVRKFCIEASSCLARSVSRQERWTNLADTYYSFLVDNKKWVFTSALQHLGEFVSTFAEPTQTKCHLNEQGDVVNDNGNIPNVATAATSTSAPNQVSPEFNTFQYWSLPIDTNNLSLSELPISVSLSAPDDNTSSTCPSLDTESLKLLRQQTLVPPRLIECYINIIHNYNDMDVLKPCAFSIPAILFTLGPSCWSYLHKSYFTLLQSMSWKVRLSLASSLHHVFQIFKHNAAAQRCLLSTFRDLLRDVDEIKVGLMHNLARLLLNMPPHLFLEIFTEDFVEFITTESPRNWRYRVCCMDQLTTVIDQLAVQSPQHMSQLIDIWQHKWLAVIFVTLQDPVCAVRQSAINLIVAILRKLQTQSPLAPATQNLSKLILTQLVEHLSSSTCWYLRQMFLHITQRIVQLQALSSLETRQYLMPAFLLIALNDAVPNNRMVAGQALVYFKVMKLIGDEGVITFDQFDETCRNLQNDSDRDVRDTVRAIRESSPF